MLGIQMVRDRLISFQKLHWIEFLSPPFQDGEALPDVFGSAGAETFEAFCFFIDIAVDLP